MLSSATAYQKQKQLKLQRSSRRVCVIGAGISGLAAIKACVEEGHSVVCFERTVAIGGVWNYRPDGPNVTVMAGTFVNTSKEIMAFSDFPPPPETPNFPHHSVALYYLECYAKHFSLTKWIHFKTEVQNLTRGSVSTAADDGIGTTEVGWTVTLSSGQMEHFDAVMVCTGRYGPANLPSIRGFDHFTGCVLHSSDYRDSRGFEDKRVLVVGIGNSALDIATELASVAKHVTLSTRRGSWILNRVWHRGLPYDIVLHSRCYQAMVHYMPWGPLNDFIEGKLERRMDHAMYGLKPVHRFFGQAPVICDSMHNLLIRGQISITDDIFEVRERSVLTTSGQELPADVIVFCTGYKCEFPFIADGLLPKEGGKRFELDQLYKYVFPPGVPGLAFIGQVDVNGALAAISELQSRWAAGVFSGRLMDSLPSKTAMLADVLTKRRRLQQELFQADNGKHTVLVNYTPYMDELAGRIGCHPRLSRLFLSDPLFAVRLFFGPNLPYVYRLRGIGCWADARSTILTVSDRVRMPLKKKCGPKGTNTVVERRVFSFVSTTEKLFLTCLLVMVFLAGSWLMCGGGTTAASPIGAYLLVSALAGTVMGLLGYTFHEEVFGSF